MTWFEDLTQYTYGRLKDNSLPPTLNVGWLEHGQDYPIGNAPAAFVERLAELVKHAPTQATRGMHYCDLCPSSDDDDHPWGHAEIRVVGDDGTRFAAPTLIHHYVTVHRYRPPDDFIYAAMRVTHLEWDDARKRDLCLGCGLTLERLEEWNALQGATRSPVIVISLRCEGCGADYQRTRPAQTRIE